MPGVVEGTIERTEDRGRTDEHDVTVARLKRERKEFLNSFPGLDESLVKSLG